MKHGIESAYLQVLKNRPFAYVWLNEILVQVAFTTVNFALIVAVFELTRKNAASSLFVFTSLLPALLFGPITGIVADKINKRTILLATDIAMGACFILLLFAQAQLGLILALAFLLNGSFQFFIPAEAATIPAVVDKSFLLQANALFYFVVTLAAVFGYSIAGPLIDLLGTPAIFIGSTVAMVIGFWLRSALPSLPPSRPLQKVHREVKPVLTEGKQAFFEGVRYIMKYPRVWIPVGIMVLLQLIASILVALGPGYMEQVIGLKPTEASTVLLLPVGIGLLIGAIAIGRIGVTIPKRYVIVMGCVTAAIGVGGIGIAPLLTNTIESVRSLIAIFGVLLGAAAACMLVPSQTVLQESTSSAVRGRIFGMLETLKAIVSALPILLVGTIADVFGIEPILIGIGLGLFLIAVIFYHYVSFEKHIDTEIV